MKYKYFYGNLDGMRQGFVKATTQKKAAEIAGVSMYQFRNYWSEGSPRKNFEPEADTLYVRSGTLFDDESWEKWESRSWTNRPKYRKR